MIAYVDTSALAAYYCPEKLSKVVERAIRKLERIATSPLVEIELCSALSLKVRTREIERTTAHRIVARLRTDLVEAFYVPLVLGAREHQLARGWICQFTTPLRTLDALHLAVAFSNDLPILTTDKALARSAKTLGVRCKLVS